MRSSTPPVRLAVFLALLMLLVAVVTRSLFAFRFCIAASHLL
jgi:hypothetical protein